jgi:methionyl aminopeptidase
VILLKSRAEVEAMKAPGRIVAEAHEKVRELVRPGVTTREIDRVVEEHIVKSDGTPAFKGYRGFPASICASVNDEVVHGIPGSRVLEEGDIIGVDIGVQFGGFYGDAAQTIGVGSISPEAEQLLRVTRDALYAGIKRAQAGNCVGDISHAVQELVEAAGCSVVRTMVGHGIGRSMHEDPQVPNFGNPGSGPKIRSGMVVAIEPMVNAGGHEVRMLDDQWTVVTGDGGLSAHFEHSVAITDEGPEILTRGAVAE